MMAVNKAKPKKLKRAHPEQPELPKKPFLPLGGKKLSEDDDEYWERISAFEKHIVYHCLR